MSVVLGPRMAAALLAALVLALLLLALRPAERSSVRNSLFVLGACAAALIVDAVASASGAHAAATMAGQAAALLVGVVLIRLAALFGFRVALRALGIEPARIVEDLFSAAWVLVWALAWLRLVGLDLASLVTTSAIITGVLAFSMQQTLGNVLGGIVLQLDRAVCEGDWVRVDDVNGRVVEISWRHTAIETRNGETVIVPNGWMMTHRFTVIGTRADRAGPWRRWIRLNVDLEAEPAQVCRVLEDAVRGAEIENVLATPGPSAVLMELGPRQGSYALRYWMRERASDDATDSRVRMHLLAALTRHGMKLAVPYQEELSMKDDAAHHEAQLAREHERRIGALAGVELFAALSAAERASLADHLVYAPFVAGDLITRQGAVAHWLYLIVSGEADVWFDSSAGRVRVGSLASGDIFGEMGMMTGEPRSATVTARTDVVCYRLDKSGFAAILQGRPDIAEALSKVLFAREAELRGRRKAGTQVPALALRADILERIRRFFGLEKELTRA